MAANGFDYDVIVIGSGWRQRRGAARDGEGLPCRRHGVGAAISPNMTRATRCTTRALRAVASMCDGGKFVRRAPSLGKPASGGFSQPMRDAGVAGATAKS
jgi:hypothetical protein